MKFTDLIVFIILISLFFMTVPSGMKSIMKIQKKAALEKRKAEACRFISESFRMTCKGCGFKDFVQWQKTCSAMWQLDYAGFGECASFMSEEESENQGAKLMYAKWIGPDLEGEAYGRVKKSESD